MFYVERGEYVIAVDNLDRENEGDLMIPGQDFTTEKAAFMIRYTRSMHLIQRGYMCIS